MANSTPETTLSQLWQALSHAPEEKPNIAKLKTLLHPKSTVYGSQVKGQQPVFSTMLGTEFIEAVNKPSSTGFYECEIARTVEEYDRFAHVYSIVETRSNKAQIAADFVGVNSIQLYRATDKWQILSMYYHIADPKLPLSLGDGQSGKCID
ncbi:hypothetical protein J8L98_21020 [Pseudoalteromonas sp. MMG013]|uniref:hypothetical protein n=1 Tax=Pseudoalteromonas sp. MMG013 TaxID=2822687 RepID=UPI001B3974E9|nr:hypothetical protein [Pseudoalteromonas sp. MMG013]MBQ4864176.1 hypothetical protein [Pseudoalteromonas sp. MMG013]